MGVTRSPRGRSYHCAEQDDLQHFEKDLGSSGLPAVHGMGISLGRCLPLGARPSKL